MEYVAPRTAAEERLAAIWEDVLRIDRVGVNDEFFALGGSSLLAMRLVAAAARVFGVQLPVASVFARPVLGELAAEVDRLAWAAGGSGGAAAEGVEEGEI